MKKLFLLFFIATLISGCIIPIPHTRIKRGKVDCHVYDAITSLPITGATVNVKFTDGTSFITQTNTSGYSLVEPEKTWHLVRILAPPSDISLFPKYTAPTPVFIKNITISANGYKAFILDWIFISEVKLDNVRLFPDETESQ